ncbi:MAG: type II secretion system protein N [Rhodospirillaceae bacterium]|nr:type II secretion system protein N [Rhodospirillaceae bacterium]
MNNRAAAALFAAVFAVVLISTVPLGLVLGAAAPQAVGVTYQRATGTVWSGSVRGVSWAGRSWGDITVRLLPLELLRGRLDIAFDGAGAMRGAGRAGLGGGMRLNAPSLTIDLAALPLSVPLAGRLEVTEADLVIDDDGCGRATARLATDALVRGIGPVNWSGPRLAGGARCEGADLVVALTGGTGADAVEITLRLKPGRAFRAEFAIASTDRAVAQALPLVGFSAQDGVYRLIQEGRWG